MADPVPRKASTAGEPMFLTGREEWRGWLQEHSATAPEVIVGVWKKGTGRPSISWPELVEEALDAEQEAAFRADPVAWQWFCAAAPSYRRIATHWVVSAVRPQTRARRFDALVEHCRDGRKLRRFDPTALPGRAGRQP